MPKNHDIHKCVPPTTDRDPSYDMEIMYFDWVPGWSMDDGHDGYIDIYYCPYCGVKLEQ